jgi:uncharacterized protein (TIRG00374 family)
LLKLFLLVLGLLTLVGLVWHIGPERIVGTITALGPLTLVLILLPSLLMYVIEAYGWRVTLIRHARAVSFGKLLAIRTAGEVVNMTTPTAYMGGEPLKAFLLSRYQVPMVDGLASVVIAKTIMSLAEVLFILLGVGLGLWLLGGAGAGSQTLAAAVIGVGLLLCGIFAFVLVQRRGLFTWMLETLRWLGLRIGYLESREDKLRSVDQAILSFYAGHRGAFLVSTVMFLLGWMTEALEVYVILACLGGPVSAAASIAIGALSVFIKGGTFFIPGSLGAQEGGNLLLLTAFGYSDVTGITFALLRRVRELVWIGIGLVCLGLLGGTPIRQPGESASPPR